MKEGLIAFHGRLERNGGKKSNLFCNCYKKLGHSIEQCYKLHGFPPNSRVKGPRRTPALVQSCEQDNDHRNHMSQPFQITVPGLTLEQSSQLIVLLQNVQLNKSGGNVGTATQGSGSDCNVGLAAFTSFVGITHKIYVYCLLFQIGRTHGLQILVPVTICVTTQAYLLITELFLGQTHSLCLMRSVFSHSFWDCFSQLIPGFTLAFTHSQL